MKTLALLAGLLSILPAAQAEPEPLGRLFLTPQQRQTLDRLRLQDPGSGNQRAFTLNGEVRRSGGSSTRWINGQADWSGNAAAPSVPVGDSYDPDSGERQSLLGGGRIHITPGSR
ncbi:MAG: hypothetical protein F9K30_01760 [Dechloromonas sp.]|nr:MAG: hypothetical protein F9K30_01760 [Dechloromonas sp.]